MKSSVPSTLLRPGAGRFWLAVLFTGLTAGLGAILLTLLLEATQRIAWPDRGLGLLAAASVGTPWRHMLTLTAAGVLTALGQLVLSRLSSGNGIDLTEAIWFHGGRLPSLRTLASACLSVVLVGLGVSLGREGAPKQAGAVFGNRFSDLGRLTDDERRLLVACGAGAGMAAAYGVPLGGALFALEVLRGNLALRLILPALLSSLVATAVAWLVLPDAPTYAIPAFPSSGASMVWALAIGPIAGVFAAAYVRAVAWADRHKAQGWRRLLAPVLSMAAIGVVSIRYPQLLGNGKDLTQLAFLGKLAPALLATLLLLRPAATILCVGTGVPGGLFTPTLAVGALLGGLLGHATGSLLPGVPLGLCSLVGAAAVLAATTQGPVSTVVLLMEMTGRDRSFVVPLLLAVIASTLVSRTIEPRSIYDARLSHEQVEARQKLREETAG